MKTTKEIVAIQNDDVSTSMDEQTKGQQEKEATESNQGTHVDTWKVV